MAPITLVGTLAAIYLVSQFLRNSVGVIAPDLAREIGLNAAEIGLLSSAFFFAFAAAQIPLGIALDRYGPKRCMLVCAAIAFAGTLVFATATTPAGLVVARILMGLGSSCYLMAPLALYARRFPPERFAQLAGIQIGIGTVGTLLVTAPLAWASAAIRLAYDVPVRRRRCRAVCPAGCVPGSGRSRRYRTCRTFRNAASKAFGV